MCFDYLALNIARRSRSVKLKKEWEGSGYYHATALSCNSPAETAGNRTIFTVPAEI
jgi:hypothetical protein